jgi:hypothetical protein
MTQRNRNSELEVRKQRPNARLGEWSGLEPLEPRLLLSASTVAASAPQELAALTLSQDISQVPFLDGETVSGGNNLTNRFGGDTSLVFNATVSHTTDPALVRTGNGAVRVDVNVAQGGFGFVITALGGVEPSPLYTDTRDITTFDQARLFLRNQTGSSFTFRFEVKDYRDSNAHRASRLYTIGAADQWTQVVVPLDLAAPGWVIVGNPDFGRARQFALLVEANQGSAVNGPVIIDDMVFVEPGGTLDPATAPVRDLVERITRRQFNALWGSRDPDTGALETNSPNGRLLAMNTTGSLVKMLPGAVDRGWISRADADAFVQAMLNTLNTTMDNVQAAGDGGFLPPRYIDRATFTSAAPFEESSIDAAFMFLALYQYKSQAGTSAALRTNIESMLDRFNFAAFSSANGWRMAWFNDSRTFTSGTYDGYGGENWTISLAAHLAQVNRVDITTNFNANVFRVKDYLVDFNNRHLVHSFDQFRPPFVQWLLDLFVDTNDRGTDSFPNPALAGNPFDNAVLYQREVNARLDQLGRGLFLQPDAGSSGTQYQQFSLYNNFGEPNVFMPWSVAFSFLGDPQFAEAALRNSLSHNLHGPFGLSDSAIWATGAAEPARYPAANDLWNTSLSTLAMLEYLYDDNQAFTDLPQVAAALDAVFPNPLLDGDLNKDGFVGIDDLNTVLGNWNQTVAPGDWFAGDPSGDGFVGIEDLNTVLGNWNAAAPPQDTSIPASTIIQTTATTAEPLAVSTTRTGKESTASDSAGSSISALQRSALAAWQFGYRPVTTPSGLTGPFPGAYQAGAARFYAPPLSLWESKDGSETPAGSDSTAVTADI